MKGNDMAARPSFWLKKHLRLTLVLLYIIVIIIPGGVLGFLALRALDREEAYVEKTLSNSLLSEVTHTVTLIQNELDSLKKELNEALPVPDAFYPYSRSPIDISRKPLIDSVFVLSDNKEILWPNDTVPLNEKENKFLSWNAPLVTDSMTIPVVKNIALEYRDQIINQTDDNLVRGRDSSLAALDRKKDAPAPSESRLMAKTESPATGYSEADSTAQAGGMLDAQGLYSNEKDASKGEVAQARSAPPADSDKDKKRDLYKTKEEKSLNLSPQRALLDEQIANREAIDRFEQNKPIQEKIYKQAEEEGKEVLTRTTVVSTKTNTTQTVERSLFVVSPGTFSDIIAGKSEGFIPRFLGDDFSLLYFKKNGGGFIVGCVVNQDALSERLLKTLPATSNPARVLVLLNNKAEPLHAPEGISPDWRIPFVAREIHEDLPRWEVAAYLADPSYVASKAEAMTSVLWVITAFLLFAITGGGVIIIKMLLSELALAQKKTNLVTNVSHELKTPLTSIRLFAEMLAADIAPAREKRREYCALLVSETERLSRLINNVLDFSKMAQGKKHYNKKQLDLIALCREVTRCEKIRLEKRGMRIRFSSSLKKVAFFGCKESLTQVLINLVSNAEKYASSGKAIDISLEKTGEAITLDVMDRGPGIPAWAANKIFKEFFRVDDSLTAKTGGSGLGLTIARMIVNDHDGEIRYLAREGGGSVFRITFPVE